jgi:hypothetical protein
MVATPRKFHSARRESLARARPNSFVTPFFEARPISESTATITPTPD